LLSRLKQSINSAKVRTGSPSRGCSHGEQDLSAFLKELSLLEDKHAQGIKRLCRTTQENIGDPEKRQGSFAHIYGEVIRVHDRMTDNSIYFATCLNAMSDELRAITAHAQRGRKHWKHSGLSTEKRVQAAEAAVEKAKTKYQLLFEQHERARAGKVPPGAFGLTAPKLPTQQEDELQKKVLAAERDHAARVQVAHTRRQELTTMMRPHAVKALQQLIQECDACLSLQLQKLAALDEKLLLGNTLCVNPENDEGYGAEAESKSLRELVQSVDNQKDFSDYILTMINNSGIAPSDVQSNPHAAPLTGQNGQGRPNPAQFFNSSHTPHEQPYGNGVNAGNGPSQAGNNGRPHMPSPGQQTPHGPLSQQQNYHNGTGQQRPQIRSFSEGAVSVGPNQGTNVGSSTPSNMNQQTPGRPAQTPFSQVNYGGMQQGVTQPPGATLANGSGFQSNAANAANAGAGRGRPPPNGYPGSQGPGHQQVRTPQPGPGNGYSSGPQPNNINGGAEHGRPPSNSYPGTQGPGYQPVNASHPGPLTQNVSGPQSNGLGGGVGRGQLQSNGYSGGPPGSQPHAVNVGAGRGHMQSNGLAGVPPGLHMNAVNGGIGRGQMASHGLPGGPPGSQQNGVSGGAGRGQLLSHGSYAGPSGSQGHSVNGGAGTGQMPSNGYPGNRQAAQPNNLNNGAGSGQMPSTGYSGSRPAPQSHQLNSGAGRGQMPANHHLGSGAAAHPNSLNPGAGRGEMNGYPGGRPASQPNNLNGGAVSHNLSSNNHPGNGGPSFDQSNPPGSHAQDFSLPNFSGNPPQHVEGLHQQGDISGPNSNTTLGGGPGHAGGNNAAGDTVTSGPPVNQRPPANQRPPSSQGPPPYRGPAVNQGQPPNRRPPNQEPPPNSGPPPPQAPPSNQSPALNHGSAASYGPSNFRPPPSHRPSSYGPPSSHSPPANPEPSSNQAPAPNYSGAPDYGRTPSQGGPAPSQGGGPPNHGRSPPSHERTPAVVINGPQERNRNDVTDNTPVPSTAGAAGQGSSDVVRDDPANLGGPSPDPHRSTTPAGAATTPAEARSGLSSTTSSRMAQLAALHAEDSSAM
jgi:hypothetical protein